MPAAIKVRQHKPPYDPAVAAEARARLEAEQAALKRRALIEGTTHHSSGVGSISVVMVLGAVGVLTLGYFLLRSK